MNIRSATPADAKQMSDLLNEIIETGGTTAHERQTTGDDLHTWMSRNPAHSVWTVAVDDGGRLLGFQWFESNPALPPDAADIATFVRVGTTGRGVGARMFDRSVSEARRLGYIWINASIRSDNAMGLGYYSKMGFETYEENPNAALSDGTLTGKTHKRFNLL